MAARGQKLSQIIHRVFGTCAALALAAGAGCGSQNLAALTNPSLVLGLVDRAPDQVILDWSGGSSDLHPSRPLAALDFTRFALRNGGTLADDAEGFKSAVLLEVEEIIRALPDAQANIRNGSRRPRELATVVHIAQNASFGPPGQIGEADYDPCNRFFDDSAVVFGEELKRLGASFEFEEWKLIFANVIAHEIGHTLGYGHVGRVSHDGTERPLFVELMLATHTVDEMTRPQRYLADESFCPASSSAKTAHAHDGKACSVVHSHE